MRIFNQTEIRIIGCLIEKEVTTPEQYPLTLNALTTACNQKSNRDPVTSMSDSDVLDSLNILVSERVVTDETRGNSRVAKYQHRFCNTEFGSLKLSKQEMAVLCVLFLRGPQTPGELRTRTQRLCEFDNVAEVESVLTTLGLSEASPMVAKLEKEPGKREARYAHLFCGEVINDVAVVDKTNVANHSNSTENDDRITLLESEVAELKAEIAQLTQLVNDLLA
ncbi:YceH family protein [Aliivibrio salmonicida]|uniref:YceH family protein n=1 Tax=Aliivibrio salmonicida TaxID=40269 RepID=UPI003D095CD8